jgi:hypothetical protein
MRPAFTTAPGEWLFAVIMAASPMIGAIWVTPDLTKWIVFGMGAVMTLVTVLLAIRPVAAQPEPES